jgi:tetratricopeptide (TPR) repeat protein
MEQVFAERLGEFQSIIGEHYLRGEGWERAVKYLLQAGDAAARLYAHPEARLHYANALKALARLPATEENRRCRVDIVVKFVTVSWSAEPLERNFARLLEVKALLKGLPGPDGRPGSDRLRWASVHFWMGRIQYLRNQPEEAVVYYQQVLAVAQELDDPELIAMPASFIGQAVAVQGHFARAETLLKRAIPALEQVANWPEWIRAVGYHSACLAAQGQVAAGMAQVQRTIRFARERNFTIGIAMSNIYIAATCLFSGDIAGMLLASHQVTDLAQKTGDRLLSYMGHGFHAWAEGRCGNFDGARADLERLEAIGKTVGPKIALSDWFMAAKAEIAFAAGQFKEACDQAQETITFAQAGGGIFAEGMAERVWGQALASLDPPQWEEAETHMTASLRALETGDCRVEVARTHLAWGKICLLRGDLAAAEGHFLKAAQQFEASGLAAELEQTKTLITLTQPVATP